MMELREPPRAVERPTVDRVTRGLLAVVLALLVGLAVWMIWRPADSARETQSVQRLREVAAKLQAAGALEQAAALYESYLRESDAPADQQARIAYSLGNNYLDSGRYDRALRWYYEAETFGVAGLEDEVAGRIVHCLERLGRHHAAQAALAGRVTLDPTTVAHPAEDPVVARVGQTEVRRSEVLRSLDDLPPELAAELSSDKGRQELLRRHVADELLWRKAIKLEYDRDPEVERRLAELTKQLAVTRFVEQEVFAGIELDPTDLENYFSVNRERYQPAESAAGKTEVTFDQVRHLVERDYRMAKMQAAYSDLIESELSTGDVELFPERMRDGS